jgi:hypothetical protein
MNKNLLHLLCTIAAEARPQHRYLIEELRDQELGKPSTVELVPDPDNEKNFVPKETQVLQAAYFGAHKPKPAAPATPATK